MFIEISYSCEKEGTTMKSVRLDCLPILIEWDVEWVIEPVFLRFYGFVIDREIEISGSEGLIGF